nr:hypothetical protein [Tanacetum cinerariifolium]
MSHRGKYPSLILDIKKLKQAALGAVSLNDVYLDQISVDFVLDSVKKKQWVPPLAKMATANVVAVVVFMDMAAVMVTCSLMALSAHAG